MLRYDAGAEERALAGSDFGAWLEATVAREQLLFGPDGEYAPDVFDPSGQEVVADDRPAPGGAGAEAGPRRGRTPSTRAAWRWRASGGGRRRWPPSAPRATLYADNPWPLFDLGRTALALGQAAAALPAFRQAAAAGAPSDADGGAPAGLGRAGGGRVGRDGRGDGVACGGAARRSAAGRAPRAASAAGEDADDEAREEAVALLEAVAPGTRLPRRLPVFLTSPPLPYPSAAFAGRGNQILTPSPACGRGRGGQAASAPRAGGPGARA